MILNDTDKRIAIKESLEECQIRCKRQDLLNLVMQIPIILQGSSRASATWERTME
jgi:hypothetical protein